MAEGEHFAVAPEVHRLSGGDPLKAQGVDGNARHLLPSRALVDVRGENRPDIGASVADELGGADSGARRRVDLRGVVRLDDLDRLVVPRGDGREVGGEHGAEGEVGHDDDARLGRGLEERAQGPLSLLAPAARADDDAEPVADGVVDDGGRDAGGRDVEHDVSAEHLAEVAARVELRDEREV